MFIKIWDTFKRWILDTKKVYKHIHMYKKI